MHLLTDPRTLPRAKHTFRKGSRGEDVRWEAPLCTGNFRMLFYFILTTDWHYLLFATEEPKALRRGEQLAHESNNRQNLNPGLTPASVPWPHLHKCPRHSLLLLLLLRLLPLGFQGGFGRLGKWKIKAGQLRSSRQLRNLVGSADCSRDGLCHPGKSKNSWGSRREKPSAWGEEN